MDQQTEKQVPFLASDSKEILKIYNVIKEFCSYVYRKSLFVLEIYVKIFTAKIICLKFALK